MACRASGHERERERKNEQRERERGGGETKRKNVSILRGGRESCRQGREFHGKIVGDLVSICRYWARHGLDQLELT